MEVFCLGRKLQMEDLLALQLPGDVQMAPAGDRVAYVLSATNQEKNEYESCIYLSDDEGEGVRFTGGSSDSAPRFSPDGNHLAFLSKRSGQSQIWVMSVHGGEARQLTRVQGGVTEYAWSPDGKRVAFVALLDREGIQPERSKEQQEKAEAQESPLKRHTRRVKVISELIHKMDGVGYYRDARPCLCTIGLEEKAEPLQLTQPPYRVAEPVWTPDASQLLFISRIGPDYDREPWQRYLYSIPAAGGEARQLSPEAYSAAWPSVSPDGARVAFLTFRPEDLGYGNPRLTLLSLESGELSFPAPAWDRPFGNVGLSDVLPPAGGRLTWSPDGSALYGLTSIDGTTQIARVDLSSGEVAEVTRGDRLIYSYQLDGRCRKLAMGIGDPLSPGDIYSLDILEGQEVRLTQVNEALLSQIELSRPERFCASAPGGPRVDGWVMKPAGFESGRKYPTVLEIHGGPMAMYASSFFFEFQMLASSGYGVIFSNPRGSQGYGEQFCMAIQQEWGNNDYADVMAVVERALADNPWVDGGRLGVTGGSYGGFMTNWIVSHTDRFKAAVTGRSICDWRTMVGTGDGGSSWIKRFNNVPPWLDDAMYKQQSPITYVENVTTPILIEHQEGDLRCPIDQGMMWYSAIKHLGRAPVRFVTYPDEFHGMSRNGKPWNRIHRLTEIRTWFDRYLNPEA